MKIDEIFELEEYTLDKYSVFLRDFINNSEFEDRKNMRLHMKSLNKEDYNKLLLDWISMDYMTSQGELLIDLYLKNNKLTKKEIKILNARKESYISIYKVTKKKSKSIILENIITKEKTRVSLNLKVFNKGDFILGRVINYFGYSGILGSYQILNKELKNIMLALIKNILDKDMDISSLGIKKKLKFASKIIYEEMDLLVRENEDDYEKYKELFIKFIFSKDISEEKSYEYINNIDMFLKKYNEADKDIEKINDTDIVKYIESFIKTDGLCENIKSHCEALNLFTYLLYDIGCIDEKNYINMLKVSNMKYYIKKSELVSLDKVFTGLKNDLDKRKKRRVKRKFSYDKGLMKKLSVYENEDNMLIKKYNVFLNYIRRNNVLLNEEKKLSKEDIKYLKGKMVRVSRGIISIFMNFSFDYNILGLDGDEIYFDVGIDYWNKIDINEKLTIFIKYIWNECKWHELNSGFKSNVDEYEERKDYLDIISNLNVNESYDYEIIDNKYKENRKVNDLFNLCKDYISFNIFKGLILPIFKYMDLIELDYNESEIEKILIKPMGMDVFKEISNK